MAARKGDKRGPAAARQLQRVYLRDEGTCQLCLTFCPRDEASRDHVIELSEGGSSLDTNIVLAHKACNLLKDQLRTGICVSA